MTRAHATPDTAPPQNNAAARLEDPTAAPGDHAGLPWKVATTRRANNAEARTKVIFINLTNGGTVCHEPRAEAPFIGEWQGFGPDRHASTYVLLRDPRMSDAEQRDTAIAAAARLVLAETPTAPIALVFALLEVIGHQHAQLARATARSAS
jgi:hypothetical protein